ILWDFMKELNEKGMTILLTTHYLEEAERLCNRLAIMDRGKLIALDATRKMISDKTERLVRLRLSSPIRTVTNTHPDILSIEQKGEWLHINCLGGVALGEILKSLGIPLQNIIDIEIQEGALETAFLRILKAGVASAK